ncbi:MAG: hypothetical protein HY748_15530, partial [Elusimicrobia bacterium]|nr:hypothetical protein [Elusimicrobiota bacterium]
MLLSGCVPRPQKKQAASAGSALPATVSKTFAKAEFNLTARVLDADTGQPIPDAWVLVTARVTTDRPATGGAPNALAAGRMLTGPDGIGRISEVRGIYFPGQPKNKLWLAFEEVRARRLGERRITGIEGGSIVAASPKYGFLHQPFAVEDGAAFEAWLQKNPGPKESYGGWLTRRYLKENLETLFIRSKDLERGFEVTLRMRKPASLDALAEAISPFAFGMGTRSAMSV